MLERTEVRLTGIRIPRVRQGTKIMINDGELSMVSDSGTRLIETGLPIPEIPDGMIGVRFHGRLAMIPQRTEGEGFVGKTGFTQRQIVALYSLDRKRLAEGTVLLDSLRSYARGLEE